MAATYRFYYTVSGNNTIQKKEYVSPHNINKVKPYFLGENQNVTKIERIDILDDPDGINTDKALGYIRSYN
jgi:hypothetical protein